MTNNDGLSLSLSLGNRMKLLEGRESARCLMPLLPALARIDGRSFHSFTRGMARPFDATLSACMVETTARLVVDTGALLGYTQSDEITLLWCQNDAREQMWFGGRIQKMVSQLAAQATLIFYTLVVERMPQYARRMPTFDARVWNVPTRAEAVNVLVWRELDAVKNSISMAASEYYSHKELTGKSGSQKQDMLHAKGVNWNDYPASLKRGTYVQRRVIAGRGFTPEEIDKLPPKHNARVNPDLVVRRNVVSIVDMPPLLTVVNREAVLFDGEVPKVGGGG